MIIHQIFTGNSLRNFNYIIACENTREAVVIDPLDSKAILEIAKNKEYKITKIINTHDHHDHTDGNTELVEATNAEVYCHYNAMNNIPKATHGVKAGDIIKIGDIKLEVLDTPGHTMAHVCILAYKNNNPYAIFSGDTLFNAGAGNCYSGCVESLYQTFVDILLKLPDEVLIYPGHDYLENNLKFTLSREPDNNYASDLLTKVQTQHCTSTMVVSSRAWREIPRCARDDTVLRKSGDNHNDFIITTIGTERQINTFFRLTSKSIINNLGNLTDNHSSEKAVFIALREWRNKW